MNNDFKLQFYFNKYKNFPLPNRNDFRKNFKKKHGEFNYVEELIIMIEKYQLKKFGMTLNNYFKVVGSEEKKKKIAYIKSRQKERLKK